MERRNSSWGFEATSWFRLCDLSQYKEEFKRVCHRPQILFTWANFRALEVLLSLQLGLKKWGMVPKERIEDSVSCSLPIVTEVYFSALKTGSSNLPMLLWRHTRLKLWQVKTRVPMGMVLPRRWRLFLSSATENKFRPTQAYKLRVGQWPCRWQGRTLPSPSVCSKSEFAKYWVCRTQTLRSVQFFHVRCLQISWWDILMEYLFLRQCYRQTRWRKRSNICWIGRGRNAPPPWYTEETVWLLFITYILMSFSMIWGQHYRMDPCSAILMRINLENAWIAFRHIRHTAVLTTCKY